MMNPPPNPHDAQARAAIRAHNIAIADARRAERKAQPLYPLDVALPVRLVECNDCGVSMRIDDPALCFSGIVEARQ